MITWLEFGITDGVSVSLVSINVWRLAGDTLNITCNFLYCNHQVHGDFLITLYKTYCEITRVSYMSSQALGEDKGKGKGCPVTCQAGSEGSYW
jgi:hypothetical protein